MKNFYELFPERFQNKTNCITPRRWLKACNEGLSSLIDRTIGTDWPANLDKLRGLEAHADDPSFQAEFMAVKRANKAALATVIVSAISYVASSLWVFPERDAP